MATELRPLRAALDPRAGMDAWIDILPLARAHETLEHLVADTRGR